MVAKPTMRAIEFFDWLILLGRVDAGLILSRVAKKSQHEIDASVTKVLREGSLDLPSISLFAEVVGLSTEFSNLPANADDFERLHKRIDYTLRNSSGVVEPIWRFSQAVGFLLWTTLPKEAEAGINRFFEEFGMSQPDLERNITHFRSENDKVRLDALNSFRKFFRERYFASVIDSTLCFLDKQEQTPI